MDAAAAAARPEAGIDSQAGPASKDSQPRPQPALPAVDAPVGSFADQQAAAPQRHVQEIQDVAMGGSPSSAGWQGLPKQPLLPIPGILELPEGLPGENQVGPKYKRGRGRSFFKEQPKKGAVCQVPGCDRSLHKLRDYYKRYKICPYHLELPCLVVEGQTIRFCQQCGRFQLLSDFEGDRRSCRRKLDKHNERRRRAEAEQKARLMEGSSNSDSDSPGSTRGTKAKRPSPYPGAKTHVNPMELMGGVGPTEMGSRLYQLAKDPSLQDYHPGLLQVLEHTGASAGMDWQTAGNLTNLALAGAGQASGPMQQQAATLPPEVLCLLDPGTQRQVLQHGAGILNSTLLSHLQHSTPVSPPQLLPNSQVSYGSSVFGSSGITLPSPSAPSSYRFPLAMALSPGSLGPSLQQQLQLQAPPPQQQQQRTQMTQSFPVAPQPLQPSGPSASVFLQHMQQQQQQAQQQHETQPAPLAGIPLLRSEPVPAAPKQEPDPASAETSDKAALLVAIAKTVGISSQELAKALFNGGVDAASAGAVGANGASTSAGGSSTAYPHFVQQQPPQQQQGSDSMQVSASAQPLPGMAPPGVVDSSRPASTNMVNGHASAFQRPTAVVQQQQHRQHQQPAVATEAAPNGPIDLSQVQHAVQNGGLNAGFASDAALLLQLVAAVESAQQQAGASSERMHSLSLKLFNCTPDRLPKNILDQLEEWIVQNKSLLDGATRPGCVQLSVSVMARGQELQQLTSSFASMVQQLTRRSLGDLRTGVLACMGSQAALVDAEGSRVVELDLASSSAVVPEVCSVRPLAVTPGYSGPILVTGRHVGGPQDTIYCRNGRTYPTTEVLGQGSLLSSHEGQAADMGWALLRIPSLQEGCHLIEAQHGMFVSAPHSLLVLNDEAAVAELRQLEHLGCNVRNVPELLHRLGTVLRFGQGRQAGTSSAANSSGAGDHAMLQRVCAAAQELVATCILNRWGAVLRLVLPLTWLSCTPQQAVAGIEGHLCGIPVLHAAALMGGADVVRALGAWAADVRYALPLDARWGGGLTALHVAALLREPEEVAVALTELSPSTAPGHWAATFARYGEESPLGLACRLSKRSLLAALSQHGVPEAGAMLAALQLQDEPAAGNPRLPLGVEDTNKELDQQRRRWTKLYGGLFAERAPPATACEKVEHARTWPLAAAAAAATSKPQRSVRSSAPTQEFSKCPAEGLRTGEQSPSSVLLSLKQCCSAEQLGSPRQLQSGSLSGSLNDLEEDEAASAALPVSPEAHWGKVRSCSAAAGFPAAWEQEAGQPVACTAPKERTSCGAKLQEAASHLKRGMPGQQLRLCHVIEPPKLESLLCALLAAVLCAMLMAAPKLQRQRLHGLLLSAVARAPLIFQPMFLLCTPVRSAFRKAHRKNRYALLALLHGALYALQYWEVQAQCGDWLASNTILSSHPAGMWMLVAVLVLQLRFALEAPSLLLSYCANILLLPATCVGQLGGCALGTVPACIAFSAARLAGTVLALPLLSVRSIDRWARRALSPLCSARSAA